MRCTRDTTTDGWGGTLWPLPGTVPAPAPWVPGCPPIAFDSFRYVVLRSSGGKDSQTEMREALRHLDAAGYPRERVIVEYDELGEDGDDGATWPGTAAIGQHLVDLYGDRPGSKDLARAQAEHYGLRFWSGKTDKRPTLLEDVRTRVSKKDGRRRWPDARNRYCTSDHKRAVGDVLLAELAEAEGLPAGEPVRILVVMGFRAGESDSRADKPVFERVERACRKGVDSRGRKTKAAAREVYQWLPIHHWTREQVWADIHESGVPYAWTYDAGMSRFSCSFCILGSRGDLVTAARLLPARAARYAQVEAEIGHTFQEKLSMADVIEAANGGTE